MEANLNKTTKELAASLIKSLKLRDHTNSDKTMVKFFGNRALALYQTTG